MLTGVSGREGMQSKMLNYTELVILFVTIHIYSKHIYTYQAVFCNINAQGLYLGDVTFEAL